MCSSFFDSVLDIEPCLFLLFYLPSPTIYPWFLLLCTSECCAISFVLLSPASYGVWAPCTAASYPSLGSPSSGWFASSQEKEYVVFQKVSLVCFSISIFCLTFTLFSKLGDGWFPFLSANITAINRQRRKLRLHLKRSNYSGLDSGVLISLLFSGFRLFYLPLICFTILLRRTCCSRTVEC